MIKLKDLIKEEHCECGGGCCSTKEQVKEEVITEKKVELYFRDDLKNKPISRQGYSEVNGQMRQMSIRMRARARARGIARRRASVARRDGRRAAS